MRQTARYSGLSQVEENRLRSAGRNLPPTVGSPSPWGQIQHVNKLAEGIISVSTAGHGGIWLSPDREASIPADCREIAREYAPANWYEEDCDVSIVGAFFAAELRATEPQFVAHCEEYISVDPRMLPVRIAVEAREPQHVFAPSPEDRMYCEHCGGSETDHRI